MSIDLTAALGGPLGRRALPSGPWFRPGPFAYGLAVAAWVVLMSRQEGCFDHADEQYQRQCYSDVLALWGPRRIDAAAIPYVEADLEYPVLTGGFIYVTRLVAGVLPLTRDRLDLTFLGVTAVALFGCFLGLVWVHLRLGTRWSALMVAGSPLVAASGLINWDLPVVALASGVLLAWARGRPGWAGTLLGLATAFKFYPALFLVPLAVLCLRSGRLGAALRVAGGAAGAWVAVNLPVYVASPAGWWHFWTFNADRGADLGSVWYAWTSSGRELSGLSGIVAAVMVLGVGLLSALWLLAPRRPRLAQALLLLVVLFLVVNKVYSPQYMLWLLPLVVLARPVWVDWAVFTFGELVYYGAVWQYLAGSLDAGDGQPRLYWAAIAIRVACELWVAGRVVRDILRPWGDPVRVGYVDDPDGGVLDGAPDAAWLVRWRRSLWPAG